MVLLEAMAHREGFYDTKNPHNRPQRNNNPCNLRYNAQSIRFGANAHDGGYAIFPSVAAGWQAVVRWLSIPGKFQEADPGDGRPKGPSGYLMGGYLGGTIEQIIYRFAPPADSNDTESYIQYVCTKTGYDRKTVVTLDMLTIPVAA